MDYIYIILLLILIIVTLRKYLKFEKFAASPDCMGLATPLGMTCGNYSVNDKQCLPDPNDCFILNNEKRCWCKILNN
jgi:hypothetical protein